MFGSKDLLFSSETYGVAKSLRFRSSASAYLSRTPASNGDRQKFTWSGWVKRGALSLSTPQVLFSAYNNSGTTDSDWFRFAFISSGAGASTDALQIEGYATTWIRTSALYRDPSSWYHVVVAVDTTSATTTITGTSTDRVRLYVNGAQITAFNIAAAPTQNLNTAVNSTSYQNRIGSINYTATPGYLDGYLAEVNFIDGQALTPTSFGFYDNNGIWQPKGYTGTYGTNGFYLKFTDVGATSGANSGYGKDFSGFNTNYWTTNNFGTTSTTSTYDSMYDSPVNASNGITGIGNYCVLNPLDVITGLTAPTFSNGNLTITGLSGASPERLGLSSFRPDSGKWYFEAVPTNPTSSNSSYIFVGAVGYSAAGNKFVGSWSAYGSTYTTGTVIGCTIDFSTGNLTFYNNNVSQGAIASGVTSGTAAAIYASCYNLSATPSWDFNFGQRPFTYTPPSGFSALNTQNMSTPTITNGAQYMAATTYTGNGGTLSVTNGGNNNAGTTFQPDFVWIKARQGVVQNILTDAVRGVSKQLCSDTTGAEVSYTNLQLTAFNPDGFTVIDAANGGYGVNGSAGGTYSGASAFYIGWQWKGGGTGVTNTSGSITSTVSANTSAGFSIVTYTGNNTAGATVGHGLGVIPSMMIVKRRSAADDWYVYHTSLGNGNCVFLDLTNASSAGSMWNSQTPTSSVFYLGTGTGTNVSTATYVAYCFAPVAGYSAFGSYVANASTDGPMVFTNFRLRFVLLKNTTRAADWIIYDSSRDLYNTETQQLYPNLSSVEASGANIDFLSNGFKIRAGSGSGINNTSGDVYIYAAFAENPFKISRAR